jgi:hypothetical protein
VLPQPALAYGRPLAMDVGTRGAWNLRNAAFVRGAELNCWAVLSLVPQQRVDVQVGGWAGLGLGWGWAGSRCGGVGGGERLLLVLARCRSGVVQSRAARCTLPAARRSLSAHCSQPLSRSPAGGVRLPGLCNLTSPAGIPRRLWRQGGRSRWPQ